ncbi:LPS-assembly protein LptD [Sulfurospirillum sp. 1612]|uniref:LPS-assembly protein LptD n=1 Tax=Sulfurospirillum sp. 1612 TaxID=3094835 RepID=UPI002F9554F7
MFIRVLFLLSVFLTFGIAQTQNVEVLAKNVKKVGYNIHAEGNVVLYSQKYLITADKADYNQQTGDLQLYGDITVLEGLEFSAKSGQASLNLNTDMGSFQPLFFFNDASNIWLSCESATSSPEYFLTQKSIVSSCNVQNPDWKIDFTSGELNRKNSFLSIYNAVFYAGDVPLLYLPYFSFSTDKTRRTGLLRPKLGFGSSEGLFYMQPIYFAPQANYDVEVDPQIRTSRGKGVHSVLRYVDSPYSTLKVGAGIFQEDDTYKTEHDLVNQEHYGLELYYDRSQLFSNKKSNNSEDGLYVDFQYLNDIDYLNTKSYNDASYDNLVTSTFNYYYKQDLNYYGLYAKYYIDTSKTSNNDTLQELPALQYHRFSTPLFFNNLLYSLDAKMKNYERISGVNATQYELNAPLTFYFSLLDDYLKFSISENIYLTHVDYTNAATPTRYGEYYRNYHKFSLYTDLSKPYDNFYHTLYLDLDFIVPSKEEKNGYFADFIPVDTEEKSLTFNLAEFFYNSQGEKKVSHTVKQQYFFNDYGYKYGDLENNLKFFFSKKINFTNTIYYSHEFSRFSKIQNAFNYDGETYQASLTYTYEHSVSRTYIDRVYTNTNFVSLSVSTNFYRNYTFFGSIDYDFKDEFFKTWKIGFKKKKKCWDFSIIYSQNITPQLSSSSSSSVNKQGIYFLFNLYPIGSVDYQIVKEDSLSTTN